MAEWGIHPKMAMSIRKIMSEFINRFRWVFLNEFSTISITINYIPVFLMVNSPLNNSTMCAPATISLFIDPINYILIWYK